jgi:dipeptidyl aminopeptidase/acylaminoacyl peptidase
MRHFPTVTGLLMVCSTLHASTEAFSVEHLVRLERVSDPRVSPSADKLIYALRETDIDANKGVNGLWIANIDGSSARRLTAKGQSVSSARFSADGQSVYFLSARSGSNQIWRLALAGGEAQQVSNVAVGVGSFVLSPDNHQIAFSADVFASCAADFACTDKQLKTQSEQKTSAQAHDLLFMRHWDTWANGTRSQVFLANISDDGLTAVKLASRDEAGKPMDADTPSKPFGDDTEYSFSADGKTLYFSNRLAGKSESWSTNFDLYSLNLSVADAKPTNLTGANKAWDTAPLPSPDGQFLYYKAMTRPGFEADRFRIIERHLSSGKEREVAPKWDRSPDSLSLSADGKTLYAVTDNLGQRQLFAIDVRSGIAKPISGSGAVGGFAAHKNGVVFVRDDLGAPANLYSVASSGTIKTIRSFNQALLSKLRFGQAEQFSFKGWNDETVYAWLVKPVDFDPNKKYPIAYLIHGGPQGSFGNQFHYRWNPQTYAGQGFATIMVDFHGSTGYGQQFTDSISQDWGGKPLVDLQMGMKAATAKYAFLDSSKACALGGSYGGYMTNWIAGAWPEGFKCLVTHAGIFDKRFMAYTTEELWFSEWENGGVPWQQAAAMEGDNPVSKIAQWQTPMLVIHGQNDHRVPFEQGIAAFTALQRKGIESRFVWFPDENHWILKPANSIKWHQEVNAWLHQYLDSEKP